MTLLETLALVYVVANTTFIGFAVYRDRIGIRRMLMDTQFENERQTLIGNCNVARDESAAYAKECTWLMKVNNDLVLEVIQLKKQKDTVEPKRSKK